MSDKQYNPTEDGDAAIAYEVLRRNTLFRAAVDRIEKNLHNDSRSARPISVRTKHGSTGHLGRRKQIQRAAKLSRSPDVSETIKALYGIRGEFAWRTIAWMIQDPHIVNCVDPMPSPAQNWRVWAPTLLTHPDDDFVPTPETHQAYIQENGKITFEKNFGELPRWMQRDLADALRNPNPSDQWLPEITDFEENGTPKAVLPEHLDFIIPAALIDAVHNKLVFIFDPNKVHRIPDIQSSFSRAAASAVNAYKASKSQAELLKGAQGIERWKQFLSIEERLKKPIKYPIEPDSVRRRANAVISPSKDGKVPNPTDRNEIKNTTDAFKAIQMAIVNAF